jgi:hypothetical protein
MGNPDSPIAVIFSLSSVDSRWARSRSALIEPLKG